MHLAKWGETRYVKPSKTPAYSLVLTQCGRWAKGFNVTRMAPDRVDCPRCVEFIRQAPYL